MDNISGKMAVKESRKSYKFNFQALEAFKYIARFKNIARIK